MVTLRNRARTLETPASPSDHQIDKNGGAQSKETHNVSGYEKFREERIKENLMRMQKLGIVDLSLKLNSVKPVRKNNSSNCKTPRSLSPLTAPGSLRRSSRLQNVTPVSYSEVHLTKKDSSLEGEHDLLREGSKPEIYTDEHEKLLGNTEMSWTLFVDGYGKDGRRIYDPVKGKTCHQCRQKTLGHRTQCSKCGTVQGQFCGDCLYMRYGENVLEANQNPNWICPVCRGICNCSLCRNAKGWAPTGILYKKISQLGFKSVAHYLIQTRRLQTDLDNVPHNNVPVSAKRSLPFADTEAMPEGKESPVSGNDHHGSVTPKYKDNKTDDQFKGEKCEETLTLENQHGDANIASASSLQQIVSSECNDYCKSSSKPESEDNKTNDVFKGKEEETTHCVGSNHGNNNNAEKSRPKLKRKPPCIPEPTSHSIAGRLRQRRRGGGGHDEQLIGMIEENIKQAGTDVPPEREAKEPK